MDWKAVPVGTMYKDFKVTKNKSIEEINSRLIELTHVPTNASVMKIANDDPENLFCLSFQTIPDSSNGVAHVLEHTVLCGSKKFPVHDPFFCMTRRSLNTYMNALTGSDFTCYPAASQIKKDFYNLLNVYLDAVFFPNIDFYSFLQEGHRFGFSEENDPHSKLIYKGIVYNEMKGALSSPNTRLQEAIHSSLFPDTTYGVNSGGNPKDIPSLTHEQLKQFHSRYYHPSRCLFFFCGSFPLDEHLDYISEHVLDKCEKKNPLPPVPSRPRFHRPRQVETTYPLTDEENQEDQTYISFSWLTTSVLNQEEILALSIIDIALMDTDASPLKKVLMKSGMCSQAYAYLDPDIYDVPFIITLKGCKASNANEIEKILFTTMQSIVDEGIPQKFIDSAMHQLEFHRCEITGDHSPYGLTLFMRSSLIKQHGADPEEGLTIHTLFDRLNKKLASDDRYFEKLIQKHLIDNNHFVRVIMKPDTTLAQLETQEEEEKLRCIQSSLSEKELQKIVDEEKKLKAFQQEQDNEDPDILPKLTVEDIPKQSIEYSLDEHKEGSLNVYHHNTFTNSILTADIAWKLPKLPEKDMWLLRLYTTILPQMGFGGRSYDENLEYIQENLGGFGASLCINIQSRDCNEFHPTFHLKGKSLYRKNRELFQVLYDATQSVDFTDKARLKEVFLKHFTAMQSSLTQSSLRYALCLAASGINEPSKLNQMWGGLDYYINIRKLAQEYNKKDNFLVDKLIEINNKMQMINEPHLILSCDSDMFSSLQKEGFYDITNLQSTESKPEFTLSKPTEIQSHAKVIASPIAFTSKVFHTVPYAHADAPALSIVANLFDHLTLHRALREQGGAYGGGATYNSQSGNFLFYSYRDPNIVTTIQAFTDAVNKIVNGDFNDLAIEQAIFEKMQSLDAPISPGSRGRLAHGWLLEGKSTEQRQQFRNSLLSTTKADIIEATKKHVAPHMYNGTTIVFAGQELIEKENLHFKQLGLPILHPQKI